MSFVDGGWVAAFVVSLVVVLIASDRLVLAVEAAGDHFHWPPGLVGLLAAAGADGPEVSSSFIALLKGAHDISLGVIVGSNLFNLAALLGLPILLVGRVAVQRYSLLLNGIVLLATTLFSSLLVLGILPIALPELLILATLIGYALMLLLPQQQVLRYLPTFLRPTPQAPGDSESEERAREQEADSEEGFPSGFTLLAQGLVATSVLIGGCDVLVNAILYLGPRLGVPPTLTGTFGLAVLTSLPNVWVAVSLARRHRGAVLVSAVCNSNVINAVFGICVPMLFVTLQPTAIVRDLDLPALGLLTMLAVALVWRGRGLGRAGASCLVVGYLAFAVLRLVRT